MSRAIRGYVFGYGSLADPNDHLTVRNAGDFPEPVYGTLSGYRRHWDIAMENWANRHDHKHYVLSPGGERPRLRVATLGIESAPGVQCNGVAVPVDDTRLAWFDQREQFLYDRVGDLRGQFEPALELPLWTYVPTAEGEAIFDAGMKEGNVYLPSDYFADVQRVFRDRGSAAWRQFETSTRRPRCPVRDLYLFRAPGDRGI
jgi:hypothetical protein